ncbi:hypothetical protein V8F33_007858 [Rhypophila sp. PSN 637]
MTSLLLLLVPGSLAAQVPLTDWPQGKGANTSLCLQSPRLRTSASRNICGQKDCHCLQDQSSLRLLIKIAFNENWPFS